MPVKNESSNSFVFWQKVMCFLGVSVKLRYLCVINKWIYNKILNNVAQMKTYVDSSGKIAVKGAQPTTNFGRKLAESVRNLMNKK